MADYNLGVYRPRPRGKFDIETRYRYLDIVTFKGGSYINCNLDTIDGVACIGILPEGQAESKAFWLCLGTKGDKGDMADMYLPYIDVTDGIWDYSLSDKIRVPESASKNTLDITNVYDGCCGIIISKKELELPVNSYYSVDYEYASIMEEADYYFYTFTYTDPGSGSEMFIWHRTVIVRNE